MMTAILGSTRILLSAVRSPQPQKFLSLSGRAFSTSPLARNQFTFNVQDEADFEKRVLKSDKPVIVDFHADWCQPCKLLAPRIEKAVDKKEGKVLLAKVDVDKLDEIAVNYSIRSLPTVVSMKNGNETNRFIGVQEDDLIETFIEKAIQ